MSVSWGMSQRFKFSSAGRLSSWSPPTLPAVYAITFKQDEHSRPKSHTVFYFGQADDLSRQAPGSNRNVQEMWLDKGGDVEELYIFIHPMPGSTLSDRMRVHEQLVTEYRPQANRY